MSLFLIVSCIILNEKEHDALLNSLQIDTADSALPESFPFSTHYIHFYDLGCVSLHDPDYETGLLPVSEDQWILSMQIVDNFFTENDSLKRFIILQRDDEKVGFRSTPNEGYTLSYCDGTDCIKEDFSWFTIPTNSRISLRFKESKIAFWVDNVNYATINVGQPRIMIDDVNSPLLFGCSNLLNDTSTRGYTGGIDNLIIAGAQASPDIFYLFLQNVPPANIAQALHDLDKEELYYWPLGEELVSDDFSHQIWEKYHDAHGMTSHIEFKPY